MIHHAVRKSNECTISLTHQTHGQMSQWGQITGCTREPIRGICGRCQNECTPTTDQSPMDGLHCDLWPMNWLESPSSRGHPRDACLRPSHRHDCESDWIANPGDCRLILTLDNDPNPVLIPYAVSPRSIIPITVVSQVRPSLLQNPEIPLFASLR